MKVYSSEQGDIVVLQRGEELHATLSQYASERGLKSAWVSGLGGSGPVTLGFYDIATKQYEWKEFEGPLEITSLTGNMTIVDGEPFWHIHGTFGVRDFSTISGHVKQMIVGLTCELHITPHPTTLTREFDEETGLKLVVQKLG